MKLKKLTAALLTAALAISLMACGGTGDANTQNGTAEEGMEAAGEQGANAENGTAEERMEAAGVQETNAETGNTEKTDETLVVQLNGYPDYLWHPGVAQTGINEEQIINAAILDRLVDYDEVNEEVVPMLAETWKADPDGKTFTFKLRSGVKMTDGSELTADDVVYSVNVWKEQCASNDTGKYIDSVEKIDDSTVKIVFNCVAPEILKMLTWGNFGIVSEDEINAVGGLEAAAQNPIMGSGKYKFKEAKQGEYVIIERNEEYWDTNYVGYFKEIKFTFVSDPNSKVQAVQSGDAQVAYDLPVAQASTFSTNADVRTYLYSNGEVEHLFYNMQDSHPTSDIRVRQAISKALDFEAIANVATAGYGKVAYSYADETAPYYAKHETEEDKARDIEGAKELLKEAGYDENNRLTLQVVTIADQLDLYTVIQANLAEVNIDVVINQVDMGGFVPAMLFDKSYDIAAIGDNTIMRTPQLTQFVSPGLAFGGPAIVMEDHVEILEKLMSAPTDEEAEKTLAEYDNKLKEDYMCTNLYGALKASIVAKDIKGFAIRERAFVDVTTMYK